MTATKAKLTQEQTIAALRRQEEGCLARIVSIQRKLAAGSQAVNRELLLQWEAELTKVHAQLIEADEQPRRVAVSLNPTPAPKKGGSVPAKYRDPESGALWSGRGREPRWIAGKDRAAFSI